MARFNEFVGPKSRTGRPQHSICCQSQVELLEKTAEYITSMRFTGLEYVADFDRLPNGDYRALVYKPFDHAAKHGYEFEAVKA